MTALYLLARLNAVVLGLCFGSVLGMAVHRIPRDRSLWWPPSACPVCGHRVRWNDNVPVASWLLLRGRCRDCQTPISPVYPLLELLGGLLGWLIFQRFVPAPWLVDLPHLAAAVSYFGFCWLLLLAAYTDLRARIIPEIASLYAVPFGVLSAVVLEQVGYLGWLDHDWRHAVLGAGAGALVAALSLGWRWVVGREGLGWGDVRLIMMIGAFLGPLPGLWVVLLLGSLLAAVVGLGTVLFTGRSSYLPFGPALCASAVTWVLYGDRIGPWLLPGA